MSKVYVIQEMPNHNISPALKFGELLVLLPPGDRNFSTEMVMADLEEGLLNFDPKDDYLLLTGDPVAIGLAVATAVNRITKYCEYDHCYVRMLKWDRQEREYLVIKADLESFR